jgi:GNAT superfamily N-acetyltransferase
VSLVDDVPEFIDPADGARYPLVRDRPQHTWLAVARVHGRPAGQAWSHLTGRLAGVFDMEVWPRYQRRGLGTGLVRAVCAAAAAAGARHAVLNATPEGEKLYSTVGFRRVGDGITWWLHR